MAKSQNIKKEGKVAKKLKIKKGSRMPLREKKIQEIKKKLIAQRKALLAEAIDALNELPGQTVFPDLGDQASAEVDRSFMLRLRGRERKLLKKIEGAIERIDQGTFGICDKCGEEIDIRRLEARPVTTMCIECKTQQEEEEKLMET
ncbi:MAG: RNA polymerase-binding protein DksA [Nitrospirota bacterium]